jgi:hypothetical protein
MSVYVRPIRHQEAVIMAPTDLQARYSERLTLLSPSLITASWASGSIDVGDYSRAIVLLNVEELSGTNPSITIKIDALDFVSGKWAEVESSNPITSTGTYALKHEVYEDVMRVRLVLSGEGASAKASVGVILKV